MGMIPSGARTTGTSVLHAGQEASFQQSSHSRVFGVDSRTE
jgi:hypothetical protein